MRAAGSINPYLYTAVAGPRDEIGRRRILRGRDLDPTEPDEVVIDEELAQQRHLGPGSHLAMATFAAAQLDTLFISPELPDPEGPVLDLLVVGVARLPVDLHPGGDMGQATYGGTMDLYLSPALYPARGDKIATFLPPLPSSPLAVLLHRGPDDQRAFERGVRRLPGGADIAIDVGGSDASYAVRTARRAVGVETMGLAALGAGLAAAGFILVAHGLARLARTATNDLEALRSLGVRPVDLTVIAAGPGLLAALLTAIGAATIAVLASPWTPIGLGRDAEISPGVRVDAVMLLGAVLLLIVGPLAAIGLSAPVVRRLAARRDHPTRRPSRLGDTIGALGAPLSSTLGARFATEPPGLRRAPLRYAAGVGALALLVVAGVATYAASVDHLATHLEAQGAVWDLTIGNPNSGDFGPDEERDLLADPLLDGLTAVAAPEGRSEIDGSEVAISGLDQLRGSVGPQPLSGRLPEHMGEILLGTRTADRLHKGAGDEVDVRVNATSVSMRVVGTAVLNNGLGYTMEIGEGSIVTIAQVQALLEGTPINSFIANVAEETDVDAAVESIGGRYDSVSRPALATEALNLQRVRGLPIALATAVSGTAALLLAVALVTASRDRRRDLLVLRAIGATRLQVSSALAWQGLWLYLGALVGLPLGIAAGRVVWFLVVRGIGATAAPEVPYLRLATISTAGLAVALVVAGAPAVHAARRPTLGARTSE